MGQKRDIILETAARLFILEGFKATGIDRIIEQSGVARMTLYNNFPSKEALIVAVLDQLGNESAQWLTDEVEVRSKKTGSKIEAMFDAFAASMAEKREPGEPQRGCPFLNISAEFTNEGCAVRAKAQSFKQELRGKIAGWLAEDGYRDTDRLAADLALLLDGAFATAQVGGPSSNGEELVQRAKQMALVLLRHEAREAA